MKNWCETCKGRGRIDDTPCTDCEGTGFKEAETSALAKFKTPEHGEIVFHKGVEGTAEIGQNIILAVQHKTNTEFQQKVIRQVQEIQKEMHKASLQQTSLQTRIDFYAQQLKAIEEGKFSIEAHTGRVLYQEKELNQTSWLSAKFGDGL